MIVTSPNGIGVAVGVDVKVKAKVFVTSGVSVRVVISVDVLLYSSKMHVEDLAQTRKVSVLKANLKESLTFYF